MRTLCFTLLLTILPASAFAETIEKIDFAKIDIGGSSQRVEPGFVGVAGAATDAAGVLGPTNLTSSAATGSVNFTIAIDNGSGGNVDWRDRGDSTSTDPLVQVGEDHVKNNAGLLEVTLTGIPAGNYEVTSYHIDASFNNLSDDVQVLVSDAVGTLVNAGVSADGSQGGAGANGLNETLMESTSMVFQFVSDGNPVSLLFDGTASAINQTPLNGLEINLLQVVPEPASIAIWSLIGIGLCGFGYFRFGRKR